MEEDIIFSDSFKLRKVVSNQYSINKSIISPPWRKILKLSSIECGKLTYCKCLGFSKYSQKNTLNMRKRMFSHNLNYSFGNI